MTNVHIQPPICTDRALELSWKDSNIRYLDHLGNSDIASKIPSVAEPLFLAFDANVRFYPCMTPEDLQNAGLDELGKSYA